MHWVASVNQETSRMHLAFGRLRQFHATNEHLQPCSFAWRWFPYNVRFLKWNSWWISCIMWIHFAAIKYVLMMPKGLVAAISQVFSLSPVKVRGKHLTGICFLSWCSGMSIFIQGGNEFSLIINCEIYIYNSMEKLSSIFTNYLYKKEYYLFWNSRMPSKTWSNYN